MMDYNEIANQYQLNFLDPFKGSSARKFRPLAPRLNISPPTHNTCLTGFHTPTTTNHHILSLNNTTRTQNNHFVGLSEENNNTKEVVGTNQVMVSSRWNPTPEQLRALEELYRRGTRTPSAEQIQHITAQLRRYGKIEGKNVFYWFQNHKARERQKRRRQLQLPSPPSGSSTNRGNRVGFEGEQMRCKWTPSPTNNKESDRPINQIIAEEIAEGKSDQTRTPTTTDNNGWIQFHEPPQFQHNHTTNNTINNNIITNTNDNNNNINNNNNNDNMINISPATNLMFAGVRNGTWQQSQNNIMVQPLTSLSSTSCCCYTTSPSPFSLSSSNCNNNNNTPILSKINHLLPDKSAMNGDVIREKPTLHLFPVLMNENEEEGNNNIIASDHGNNINVDMSKEDERENDASLLLLQTTCCNIEKATSMTSFNRSSNNNNPFPYYQFL